MSRRINQRVKASRRPTTLGEAIPEAVWRYLGPCGEPCEVIVDPDCPAPMVAIKNEEGEHWVFPEWLKEAPTSSPL